ncbi:phosphotransferase enzyme family protein [Actinopolymorpha pittospori]
MLEAPEDLTAEHISAALRTWWGVDPVDVNYAAVGHGSHNWIVLAADATRWFVKADRKGEDTSAFFHSTYETAAVLRDCGLDFVHAAVRDRSGQLRREASPSWEIGVFPFIDGRNPDFHGSAAERAQIAETIGRLHAHPPTAVPALRWEPGYSQPELRQLLATIRDRPWSRGPYAQAAYDLFTTSAPGIEELFTLQGHLVDRLRRAVDPWVITHGEPHGGNTMLDLAKEIHLIDCNAMMLAPRERDLWLLLYVGHEVPLDVDNTEVLAAYQRGAGPFAPRPFVLELFRAEWHLSEISGYLQEFSTLHGDSEDAANDWHYLNRYLPVTRNWPEIRVRT